MVSSRRFEWLLFLACFIAFAWFHQGGGWNQNARFAEVRAVVEEGRFPIDNFLIYKHAPDQPEGRKFVRLPVDHAEYEWRDQRYRLSWVDMDWNLFPVNEAPADPGVKNSAMVEECNSGDIGYIAPTGHFHPNKPPGTTLFALPAYWLIYHFEKWRGLDPDEWWTLTVNAWLTSVFSVGLVSAFGCVIVFRLGREMTGGAWLPALLAALALAFGTTYLPFGTMLFDHNLTATLLLVAFFCLWRVRRKAGDSASFAFLAGICAGLAALTNYIAAGAGFFLGLYLLLATRPIAGWRRWNWAGAVFFTLGVLPSFVMLCGYNILNFGGPLKLANDFQNPLFKDTGAFLGMFHMPNPYVAALLTVSPYRGIFFLAPVTIMSLYGAYVWFREKTFVAETRLCLVIFAFFFLVNVCFNGYHGGFSAGPRYLVPGLPFLALLLVVAFARQRLLSSVLLVISVGQQLLLTATDGQNSLAVGGHARIDDAHRKDDFFCQIVGEYAWPLFIHGQATPVLNQLIAARLDKEKTELEESNKPEPERKAQLAASEKDLRKSVRERNPIPFLLSAIRGPVSVNPIGIYDGLLAFKETGRSADAVDPGFFSAGSVETNWNSFNAGEFLFPQSRSSLLPLLLLTGGLSGWLLRAATRADAERKSMPA